VESVLFDADGAIGASKTGSGGGTTALAAAGAPIASSRVRNTAT
jgi:hypothetical protein